MNGVWIVCKAEVKRRVRSRAFQIGLVVGMLGIAAMIRIPDFMAERVTASQHAIVLAGPPALTARAKELLGTDYRIAAIRDRIAVPTARELDRLGASRVVALSADRAGLAVTVYVKNSQSSDSDRIAQRLAPLNVELAQHVSPAQAAKLIDVRVTVRGVGDAFRSAASAAVARAAAFGLLLILYLVIILNSQLTLNSVIEEKTDRIAESLVAAIDPLVLLYGKIGAGMVLAAIQMAAWLVAGVASGVDLGSATTAAHADTLTLAALADAVKPLVLPGFFFLLFVGLLQFSTIYAAIGSLVSRPEELGGIVSALIMPIVVAFITAILALDAPNAPFVVVASMVPLISPFVMFVRIAVGDPAPWQLIVCAVVNLAFLAIAGIAAGRLYRVGMLLYGRGPNLRQLWTTIRGKAAI